jgi:hypothetical protein
MHFYNILQQSSFYLFLARWQFKPTLFQCIFVLVTNPTPDIALNIGTQIHNVMKPSCGQIQHIAGFHHHLTMQCIPELGMQIPIGGIGPIEAGR